MDDNQINGLLIEYQVCGATRDHYDSVRWTIGSIFVAASMALFGITFLVPVVKSVWDTLVIATFSSLLFAVWYAYYQHVNPWIIDSINRMYKIEDELGALGVKIKLQHTIRGDNAKPLTGRRFPVIGGFQITVFLVAVFAAAWIIRVILLWAGP